MRYGNVAARLFNTPLLLDDRKANAVVCGLAERFGLARLITRRAGETVMLDREATDAEAGRGAMRAGEGFRIFDFDPASGIAAIEIEGILTHKLGTVRPWSGMTGYDGIAVQLRAALDDPEVRGILLDIHSPGGEVAGCFALAREIRAARAVKPVWALVNEVATSAAYALASASSHIFLPASGEVGSIGVVTLHADFSRALDKDGVTVTLIFAGAQKADGNPFAPLPEPVARRWQAELDGLREQFVAEIAAGRPALGAAAARATEAGIHMGSEAVERRLADGVADPRDVVAAFAEELAARDSAAATARTAGKALTARARR